MLFVRVQTTTAVTQKQKKPCKGCHKFKSTELLSPRPEKLRMVFGEEEEGIFSKRLEAIDGQQPWRQLMFFKLC